MQRYQLTLDLVVVVASDKDISAAAFQLLDRDRMRAVQPQTSSKVRCALDHCRTDGQASARGMGGRQHARGMRIDARLSTLSSK